MFTRLLMPIFVAACSCLVVWLTICWNSSAHTHPPLWQFGTKTAYRNLEGSPESATPPQDCRFRHLVMVLRHGSRQPSAKDIRKAERLALRLQHSYTASADFSSAFRDWRSAFNLAEAKDITAVGREEHENIGRRVLHAFPGLSSSVNLGDKIHFFSSDTQRSQQSMASFQKSFGSATSSKVYLDNHLLRFFENCPHFRTTIDKNVSALHEFEAFKQSSWMQAAVEMTAKRLQLSDVTLLADDLQTAYYMCGFEVANNVSSAEHSPWCRLVNDPEVLHVMEYLYDLKHYWRKAYGYEMSYKVSCPLAWKVRELLRNSVNSESSASSPPEAHFFFGHAETILPLMAVLGLYNSSSGRLTSIGYPAQRENRLFRSSRIMPFAGNLALALYSCPHRINLLDILVNERSVIKKLGICQDFEQAAEPGRSLCDLDEILFRVSEHCDPKKFNFHERCKLKSEHDEL